MALLRDVRGRIAARSPEGIIIGEYCDVFAAEAIDLWMSWYTDFDDLRRSLYSVPQTMQSWVVDADPAAATRAFVAGAQLCLTTHGGESHLGEVPEFARHVQRLAALRSGTRGLWRGRYRDGAGFRLDADGPAIAAAHAGPAGTVIVVGSPGGAGRAVITLDRDRLPRTPDGIRVVRLDGSTDTIPGDRVDVSLVRDEVAVLLA